MAERRYTPLAEVLAGIGPNATRRKLLQFCRANGVPFLDLNGDVFFDAIALEKLGEACRYTSADAKTHARSKSTVRSARPERKLVSEFESALALMKKLRQEKKQSRSNGKSSATTTSAPVLTFAPSLKHPNHT